MKNLIREIQRRLRYEPGIGKFFWVAENRFHPRLIGKEAGSVRASKSGDRVYIKLGGKAYPASRIAFVLMTGSFPVVADHINGNTLDNRWSNLRDLTHQENVWNINPNRKKSSGLPLGVRKLNKAFQARIKVHGKTVYLGIFHTASQAHKAYLTAKRELHSSFARSK